jgi:hypothetical protein
MAVKMAIKQGKFNEYKHYTCKSQNASNGGVITGFTKTDYKLGVVHMEKNNQYTIFLLTPHILDISTFKQNTFRS